ncbi:MAG: hypothetical protein RIQ43_866, partial [Pseudomonadota bacterium]
MRCPVRTDSEDSYALDADLHACGRRFGGLCQSFATTATRADGSAAASAPTAATHARGVGEPRRT